MPRPVVGICGNAYMVNDQYPVQACAMHNIQAIRHVSGALPLMISTDDPEQDIDTLFEICDGFVFGGARPNVHPEEYGHEPTDAHGDFDRDRDRLALPVIRRAVDEGVPVLGICRGFQEFNVAFGGTLHPEIRDIPGRMNHRMPPDGTIEEKFAHRHIVSLDEGSVFRDIFGADEVLTNSLHGQGILDPGVRISIEGHAPDGTPEAISIRDAQGFALAVQWHPEYNASNDAVSKPLFEAFGTAVSKYSAARKC